MSNRFFAPIEYIPLREALMTMLAVSVAAGCATTSGPEASTAAAPAAARVAPVLRLIDITPADGAEVDSATVLVATLAYHIPNFDPDRTYMVSAVFASSEGGTFNRGGGQAQIRSPTGIATVRHSLERLWTGGPNRPTTPVAGAFFLLEHDPIPTAVDTLHVSDRVRIRAATSPSRVRARTRTFYFNGAGPARTLATELPELLEEYWTYQPHKALAVAYDAPRRWTHGYAYGHRSHEDAAERALAECQAAAERRGISAPCRLLAVNEESADP